MSMSTMHDHNRREGSHASFVGQGEDIEIADTNT